MPRGCKICLSRYELKPKISCSNIKHSIKYLNHKKESKKSRKKIKEQILNKLGKRCFKCGETNIKYLEIKNLKKDGIRYENNKIYYAIKHGEKPKNEVRVLCKSCNKHKRTKCRKCKIFLNRKNWYRSLKRCGNNLCVLCANKKSRLKSKLNKEHRIKTRKLWLDNNRDLVKEWEKITRKRSKDKKYRTYALWLLRLKIESLKRLGGVFCVNCGCKRLELLDINHKTPINNRKRKLHGRTMFLAILRNEVDISALNVLCKLCNWAHYFEYKYKVKYDIKYKGKIT